MRTSHRIETKSRFINIAYSSCIAKQLVKKGHLHSILNTPADVPIKEARVNVNVSTKRVVSVDKTDSNDNVSNNNSNDVNEIDLIVMIVHV